MTFDEAARTKLPFGQYTGMTLDQIARTDSGLRYLDKLRGWDALWPRTKEALDAYLGHPPIARELAELANE